LATKHFLGWVERQARCLRGKLDLAPLSILDPYQLADTLGAHIISPRDVLGMPSDDLRQLLHDDANGWSGGSVRLPTGQWLIVLNPTHPDTRKRATLMEELSHLFLDHKPCQIMKIDGRLSFRSYKKSQETEAYWVGAAALLPLNLMTHAQTNGVAREVIAHQHRVSVSLVIFRERVTGISLG